LDVASDVTSLVTSKNS